MPHLLNVSIGPVQEFIASARRCQDLWYGSWLLSELSRTVAEYLHTHGAEVIVFPGGLATAEGLDQDASVANKVLAVIPGDASRVRNAAAGAKDAMLVRLESLAEPVFKSAYKDLPEEKIAEAREMARQQMVDLMEFQWVAVPYDGNDYSSARNEAERLLMAAKNTKSWTQPKWSRPGWRKSSLDGVRESVIPEPFFDNQNGESDEKRAERLYAQFHIRPAERLCGVGLLKRWGFDVASEHGKHGRFHSTSHMAAAPLRNRAATMKDEPAVCQAWDTYRATLKEAPFQDQLLVEGLDHPLFKNYDGSVLYPNRLREVFFSGSDARRATGPHADCCEQAEKALQGLLRALSVCEPNAHYVLLLADGDRMGAAIDHQKTIRGHQEISTTLDAFAKGVKGVVSGHGGSLIYSGGDDVLAMLPLHTCLDCAQELAKDFAEKLKEFPTEEGLLPTLSVGLAIAHHLEDFADVRVWAGLAEKRAKNNGRNSLAIRLEKRGGSPIEACGSWDSTFLERLRGWVDLHAAGQVPNNLPFQWAELIRLAKDNPAMNELVMLDAKRLLARKGEGKAGTKDVSAIQAYFDEQRNPAVLESLSNELQLAKEIEQATREAEAPCAVSQEAR